MALLGPSDDAEATRTERLHQAIPLGAAAALSPVVPERLAVPPLADPARGARAWGQESLNEPWEVVSVRSGDSLAAILSRLGFARGTWLEIINAGDAAKLLERLHPGQILKFWRDDEGQLERLRLVLNATDTLEITRQDEGYAAQLHEAPLETRINYARGVIEDSLYGSGQRAGLADAVIMQLVNIFGWDIDFALDVRSGDTFMLVFEEFFKDGEKTGDGTIFAAEFTNQGRVYRAVRYTDPNGYTGYYDPDGLAMRKTFLRSPVDFRRISSGFQRERYHPILGKKRPHRGVDYAAAIGTPIKATGDGKVVFKGWKGGYGHTLVIQHGGTYSTLYAHLSSYRRGIRVGSRVRQGQAIGYVGKSGMATGPHLHYEFLVNGGHRNPLTVKLPKAEPIRPQYREDFLRHSGSLLAQLDVLKRTAVAANWLP